MGYNDPNRETADWWKDTHNWPGHDGGPSTGPYAGSSYDANSSNRRISPPTDSYGGSASSCTYPPTNGYDGSSGTYTSRSVYTGGGVTHSGKAGEGDVLDGIILTALLSGAIYGVYNLYLLPNNREDLSSFDHKVDVFYKSLFAPLGFILANIYKVLGKTWGYFASHPITTNPNINFIIALAAICLMIVIPSWLFWVSVSKVAHKIANKFPILLITFVCAVATIACLPRFSLIIYAIYVEVRRHL